MDPKEIRLEVAGGVIAGQEWKPQNPSRKVLMLHGWQDNSNSYKPLSALLPTDWWMVAIDFPGHGLSTPRPPGAAYHVTDWTFDVLQAVKKLGWSKFTIIGHSMGAGVGLVYAALFPDAVEAVVSLDVVKQMSDPGVNFAQTLRKAVLTLTDFDSKIGANGEAANETFPTKEEASNWWYERNKAFMTKEAADIILERGLRKRDQEGDFEIRRDIRLTFPPIFRVPLDQHRVIMNELKCDLLIIKAEQAQDWEPEGVLKEFLDMYAKNSSRFVHAKVPGLHHVHLSNPSAVAPVIIEFMQKLSSA